MRLAGPEELKEDTKLAAIIQLTRTRLAELFPVEFRDVDPLSAAEPSVGGLIQLDGGLYTVVVYGKITGETEVSFPISSAEDRSWDAFLREVPLTGKEIIWTAPTLAHRTETKKISSVQRATDRTPRAEVPSDKLKAAESALTHIERQFGKGSIMRLGAKEFIPISAISTGSIGLDLALGVGGVPRGRIIEIFGPESSGKTTISLHVIAEAQKSGGLAAFIDAEHALDADYAKKLGVDIDNLLVSQPDNGEQALEIAELLVRSGAIDVIVIDSVAALVPRAELDGEMGESHMGLHARLMSQALRKLTAIVSKSKTSLIFINQIRDKIGVMFGNPEATTGGRALKFYSSIRIDIRRTNQIKEGDEVIGTRVKVKVVKNKCAAPFRHTEFDIGYRGISKAGELIEMALENKIIDKSGSWFLFGDIRLGHGWQNAKLFIEQNRDLYDEIEAKVRHALGMGDPELESIAGGEAGVSSTPTKPRLAAKLR